jgi:two-component system, NtrC family, response regulator AtoC
VIAALAACGGNQSRAARMLGVARNTLIARIRQYGLARPQRQAKLP